MGRVLVVDDEAAMRFALAELLREHGHEAVLAPGGHEALASLDRVDTVIVDYAMPEMDGLELLERIRQRDASIPVVMVTAHGSERLAVHAIQRGAYDYLHKPFEPDELARVIDRAVEASLLRREERRGRIERSVGKRVIAESASMRRLLADVERIARRDITVLVTGESGTGKEVIASLLHAQSPRANGSLVRFNCAALPGELAEAELFGHAKGAFTGASAQRSGFFARADGGTLVLDEVGELPLAIQAKLLRALQNGEIQPVGAGRTDRVDARVVACTNRDLEADASSGRFRSDLYFRLAVVVLRVPPLRERREDIPALARELCARYGERFGIGDVRLSERLVAELARRDWPGNVRELENAIARLVGLSDGGEIDLDRLEDARPAPEPRESETEGAGLSLREQVQAFERGLIVRALEEAHGNQVRAAQALRTSRATLIDKMRKYGLRRPSDRDDEDDDDT
ncbi:sigma-54-dependent transcriptional regulator [Sandaracinus amylolyticus]|uniref:Nitrogen regulation protein NtrX n=1 Tax=Sandaracinus amylolyticus TaxID=927083 RepID=A0A0F6VZA4_9BACT|nr:sigma-54 dependent transcriptional regulator [Sandaracinus amylolyticus]AKF03436.1 Nitrogen regulation protein NtrX [Sandaracinus amylolyticus]